MIPGRVREAGDSALLLELEPVIDPGINMHAIAAANAIRSLALPGVRDVVSTYRTVAVYFDPLSVSIDDLRAALERTAGAAGPEPESRSLDVPIVYGGEYGPDLEEVAGFGRMSAEAAVARHAGTTYRVFMVGFLPGFAYMGVVDPAIAAPRRSTPRLRVPAGSIGIAGAQTGGYPVDSPGGWQIIGRTPLTLFDPHRADPVLFAPGDRVRFVPVPSFEPANGIGNREGPATPELPSLPRITVLKPGLFTTIQDEGRWGHQHTGVPVSGAMDLASHWLANALVGNDRQAATLEVTIAGPELRVEGATTVAVAGADLGATLNHMALRPGEAAVCSDGGVLRFGIRRSGGRAYVAFGGGVEVPRVLGSRATNIRVRMGGLEGRALRAGDRLGLGPSAHSIMCMDQGPPVKGRGARLRVMRGPQDDFFPDSAFDILTSTRFVVTPQSDRMGYRLTAPRRIPRFDREMISDATFPGAIQVPPSGEPILLMADRQTTGGYPQIAIVITADLPHAGQLVPGDWLEFSLCSRADAVAALASSGEGRAAGE